MFIRLLFWDIIIGLHALEALVIFLERLITLDSKYQNSVETVAQVFLV